MRGKVLRVNPATRSGLIAGEDGGQHPFGPGDCRGDLAYGDLVDFEPLDGRATGILVLQPATPATAARSQPAPHRPQPGVWALFRRAVTVRYADSRGRASRKEYWSFILISWCLVLAPIGLAMALDSVRAGVLFAEGPFGPTGVVVAGAICLGLFLPSTCVLIRRFHDTDRSGWGILVSLLPYIGALIVVLITLLPSDARVNRYGRLPFYDV